jgi:hypothetical protein
VSLSLPWAWKDGHQLAGALLAHDFQEQCEAELRSTCLSLFPGPGKMTNWQGPFWPTISRNNTKQSSRRRVSLSSLRAWKDDQLAGALLAHDFQEQHENTKQSSGRRVCHFAGNDPEEWKTKSLKFETVLRGVLLPSRRVSPLKDQLTVTCLSLSLKIQLIDDQVG